MLSSATPALPHRTSSRTRCVEIPSFHLWGMGLHSVDALTLTLTLTSCATAVESVHRLSRSVIELRTWQAFSEATLTNPRSVYHHQSCRRSSISLVDGYTFNHHMQ